MASSKAGCLLSKLCNFRIVKDGRMYFELQNWAPTFLGKYGDDLAGVKVPGRGYIGEDYLQVFLRQFPKGPKYPYGEYLPKPKGNYYYRNHTLYHVGTLDPLGL